jgi:hypothetical protein
VKAGFILMVKSRSYYKYRSLDRWIDGSVKKKKKLEMTILYPLHWKLFNSNTLNQQTIPQIQR